MILRSVILRSRATKNLGGVREERFFTFAEFILSAVEGLRFRMTLPLRFIVVNS
jgi:hypothetical protein